MSTIKLTESTPTAKQARNEVILQGGFLIVTAGFGGVLVYFYVTDPSSGLYTLGLGLAFCLMTLIIINALIKNVKKIALARKLTAEGVTVRGTILQLSSNLTTSDKRWYITYTFTDNTDRTYEVNRRIFLQQYASLNEGDTLEIRYLPQDPRIHRPTLE